MKKTSDPSEIAKNIAFKRILIIPHFSQHFAQFFICNILHSYNVDQFNICLYLNWPHSIRQTSHSFLSAMVRHLEAHNSVINFRCELAQNFRICASMHTKQLEHSSFERKKNLTFYAMELHFNGLFQLNFVLNLWNVARNVQLWKCGNKTSIPFYDYKPNQVKPRQRQGLLFVRRLIFHQFCLLKRLHWFLLVLLLLR